MLFSRLSHIRLALQNSTAVLMSEPITESPNVTVLTAFPHNLIIRLIPVIGINLSVRPQVIAFEMTRLNVKRSRELREQAALETAYPYSDFRRENHGRGNCPQLRAARRSADSAGLPQQQRLKASRIPRDWQHRNRAGRRIVG